MNTTLAIILQLAALILFIALIWGAVKNENWKEKFIDNKHARSLLIVFIIIFVFMTLTGIFLDRLFPIEYLY